jgi:acetylornithine deacetylase/succinyl-diaminopimelate desuccinylase-like protein
MEGDHNGYAMLSCPKAASTKCNPLANEDNLNLKLNCRIDESSHFIIVTFVHARRILQLALLRFKVLGDLGTSLVLTMAEATYWGDDPILLTQALTRINSSNPGLSATHGAGEKEIATHSTTWLKHHSIETHWIEDTPGRPSIVGVVRGQGRGQSLMQNGHIDTVTLAGYEGDALSGEIDGDNIHGRGTMDMKAGVAASIVALKRAKRMGLRGDVILAAVADEENLSIGTEQVLKHGWMVDGAVVVELSDHDIVTAHKGFVWVEVNILGRAAHGSRPRDGIDSIVKAGHFLVELEKHAKELSRRIPHPELGTGITHASLIRGGGSHRVFPPSVQSPLSDA